jgi:D-alanyl-D-alanine dipeptidase
VSADARAAAAAFVLAALVAGGCTRPASVAPAPVVERAPAAVVAPRAPAAAAARPAAAGPPIADSATAAAMLVDVRSADSTVRIDARYATPFNFTGAVLPGYEAPRVLLRREAADALARVQTLLRAEGLGLKVYDGYRPVRATEAMVAWARRVRREDLLRDGYIAERSRHNLGLAVDCTLVELGSGRELRMGTAFDTFARAAHTANAEGEVAANRGRLVRAMAAAGFTNLPEEWWHFSYDVPDPVRFDLVIR